jgi:Domain of unknown function (DUF222)
VPDPTPGPGQDGEQDTASSGGRPGFAWVPGSAGTGPVPSPGLDWQALLEALAAGGLLDGDPDGQDAVAAGEQAAVAGGRVSQRLAPGQAGALAVEHMAPGAAQAGWLAAAAAEAGGLDEYGLAGVAIAARRLASWAQAAELAAVAQITARAAAADAGVGLQADGRPARLCRDAVGQVGLALMLTDHAAAGWADLAVTLAWRLPATGAALAAGRVDLARARVIAETTSVLSEDVARAVEAAVLPEAGRQTTAQVRVRLRRAVIAADPGGAERRREEAERQAKVSLYAGEDGTATLAGAGLPAVEAAAAMARITAIARAAKAAGQGGGLDLHRARVMLGLLLGTLPYIPPPGGAPEPESPPAGHDHPGGAPEPEPPPGGDSPAGGSPGDPGGPRDDLPAPRDADAPADDGLEDRDPGGDPGDGPDDSPQDGEDDWPGTAPVPPWPGLGAIPPALARPGTADGRPVPGLLDLTLPWTTLTGLCAAPGLLGRIGPITARQARQLAGAAQADPAAQWRIIVTNPAGQALTVTRIPRRRVRDGPVPARDGPAPARDGPAPARDRPQAARSSPPGTGLAGRITLTITQDTIREHTTTQPGPAAGDAGPGPPAGAARPGPPAGAAPPRPPAQIATAALKAAARALDTALAQARADAAAGGCAHHARAPGYRPPPRLREQVTARDVTCRNPACRQPAWRADLDHTRPWEDGGPTCSCNLGGACRRHHQLKQHPRWKLEQTRPGHFTWTTPAGRTYTTGPDTHPV